MGVKMRKPMKAFISQPMKGKSSKDIRSGRDMIAVKLRDEGV
jgi:hypothetical protein